MFEFKLYELLTYGFILSFGYCCIGVLTSQIFGKKKDIIDCNDDEQMLSLVLWPIFLIGGIIFYLLKYTLGYLWLALCMPVTVYRLKQESKKKRRKRK